jgi:hypothetical protein
MNKVVSESPEGTKIEQTYRFTFQDFAIKTTNSTIDGAYKTTNTKSI